MTGLTTAQHLAILRTEGARLAAMPAGELDAPVPSLPDWTLERVVRHTGKVHQWVTGLLAAPPDVDPRTVSAATIGIPRGADCLPAYRTSLDAVVVALAAHEPDKAVASFRGVDDVRFWCRRQAHEVTVHRVDAGDAVHAAGGPSPEAVDPQGAVDGIDEWLHVFVATRHTQRVGLIGEQLRARTLGIHVSDGSGWKLQFAPDGSGCAVTQAATPVQLDAVDALLSGTPEAVLLACWRRRPLNSLDVRGDLELAEVFYDTLHF